MKKFLPLLMIFAAVAYFKPVQAQQKAKWKELEAFHEVMSKTFHPAEEGKLEPIRTRSQKCWKRPLPGKILLPRKDMIKMR